jgi:hypothetical protein
MMLVQRKFVGASMLCCRANDEDAGRLLRFRASTGLAFSPQAHKTNQNG